MAVVWKQTVTQWGDSVNAPAVSGSFTPTSSGDQLVAFGCDSSNSTSAVIQGTGSYAQVGVNFVDGSSGTSCYWNSSCGGASQTISVSGAAGDSIDGWAFEYSGASAGNYAGVVRTNPGTGSGAILGTSISVPVGAVLLALCFSASGLTTTVSSPTGTNRGHATAGTGVGGWCVTEYAGAGANIQPSFTDSVFGGSGSYVIVQVLLSAPAGAAQPPDPDLQFFVDDPVDADWQESDWDLYGGVGPDVVAPPSYALSCDLYF